jgi:hypothetical protein
MVTPIKLANWEIELPAHTPSVSRYKIVLRIGLVVAFYALILLLGTYFGSVIRNLVGEEFRTIHAPSLQLVVAGSALIFAIASALPFVPGAEIGLGMLMLLGGQYALLVYLCMLFALMLAFTIGRIVPLNAISKAFGWLNLRKAQSLLARLDGLAPDERMDLLMANAPKRFVPSLLRYRYVALIVLVNTPGNSIIGGGGGIALMAGLSGLFKWYYFALAMAVAIAPIPIAFYLAM